MNAIDWLAIVHPTLAVAFVFPMVGIVVRFAWQTRQRRLATKRSAIPPVVGAEHVKVGRWLAGGVVGLTLLAYGFVLFIWKYNLFDGALWGDRGGIFVLQLAFFVATIASFVLLYRSRSPQWRGTFAALTSIGIIVLGSQEGIYRRTEEWFISHYYYGVTVAILMVISVAITPEIYRDRSQRWRLAHAAVNTFAVLLFFGQGLTGSRDLLEIALSWQTPVINSQCDWGAKTCKVPGEATPQP